MTKVLAFWTATITVAIATGVVLVRTSMPYWGYLRAVFDPPPSIDPQAQGNPFAAQYTSFEKTQELTSAQTLSGINRFVPSQGLTAQWAVDVYTLNLEIRIEDGTLSPITAEVYVPRRAAGDRSTFPLIVYGAGTTGLNSRCAPSREDQRNPDLGNYTNQMIAQASQGYVVALPNYEGLDTDSRRHSYFNSELEARTLLGTAMVLTQSAPARDLPLVSKAVFFGGYSQGGHAAFAAADKAATYAPGMVVGGVYGHGPTTDITDFLEFNPNLAPYFVYAYREYYPDFVAEDILSTRWLGRLDSAADLCVDEAFQYNSTNGAMMYTREFWQALRADDTDEALNAAYPELHESFRLNDAGRNYVRTPTLILQGRQDPIAPPASQQRFIDSLCERDVPVSVQWYDNLDHFDTRQRSFQDTNRWINAVSAGEPVDIVCQ